MKVSEYLKDMATRDITFKVADFLIEKLTTAAVDAVLLKLTALNIPSKIPKT